MHGTSELLMVELAEARRTKLREDAMEGKLTPRRAMSRMFYVRNLTQEGARTSLVLSPRARQLGLAESGGGRRKEEGARSKEERKAERQDRKTALHIHPQSQLIGLLDPCI